MKISNLFILIRRLRSYLLKTVISSNFIEYTEVFILIVLNILTGIFVSNYTSALSVKQNILQQLYIVSFFCSFALFKVTIISIRSFEKPIEEIVAIMNSYSPGGVKHLLNSDFVDIYESKLDKCSKIKVATNSIGEFDMDNCVLEVIAENLIKNTTYDYYIPSNTREERIHLFVERVMHKIHLKTDNLEEISSAKRNLRFFKYYDGIVLCNLAILENAINGSPKKKYAFWYTTDNDHKDMAVYLEFREENIEKLQKLFKTLSKCSWQYNITQSH